MKRKESLHMFNINVRYFSNIFHPRLIASAHAEP
jgi:hypothetical protein